MKNNLIKYSNLKKWEGTLAKCIRCGYCFEHCPIFKHTRWESDAPRAKIIMLHGLLSGNLEPSDYIAEKLFSCFFCKKCETACSSGVPLTEIFIDARLDLIEAGFNIPGTTSLTEPVCATCLACVRECPHEARSIVNNKIVTDPVKCQSCGRCIEVCPTNAAILGLNFGTSKEDLTNETSEYLQKSKESKAIVFACNWSYFPDLQSSRLVTTEDKNYKIIVTMCGNKLEKETIIEAFLNNAKGVLVACCPDGDCEHKGNEKAESNVKYVKKLLQSLSMDPEQIKLVHIENGDKSGFQAEIDIFMEELEKQKLSGNN